MNDYLKNLIESPRLFGISYYFNELRTEIDLSFSLKTDLSTKNVWIEMIQRLDSFEKECLNKHKTDQFNQLVDSENLTQSSIYKQIIKLEKMLFSNRTLIFVNRSPSEALSLERLLVIQNEYIGKSGTDYIKGKSPMPSKLDQEALRSHIIKEKVNLLISTNNFSQINEIQFNPLELNEINLSNCNLTSIEIDSFDGLTNLNSVSLSDNELEILHYNTFSSCCSLKEIDLSGNKLTELNCNLFKDLIGLTLVNLAYNDLKTIGNCFRNLKSLKHINLSSNQIFSIELEAFNGLVQLTTLDLSSNRFKAIDSRIFNDLIELVTLNLADNQLDTMNQICLPKLEYLNLAINNLCNLECLKGLPNLVEINLAYNLLEALPKLLFSELKRLSYIHLHNNSLGNLHFDLFKGLERSLEHVYLADNRLDSLDKNLFESQYQFQIHW